MSAQKDLIREFMGWNKKRPCFISSVYGVDVAHLALPVRRGYGMQPRVDMLLDKTKRGHGVPYGMYCIPLQPKYHRQDSPYPYSLHRMGEEEFFRHHGISEAEVFSYLAQSMAEFFLDRAEQT